MIFSSLDFVAVLLPIYAMIVMLAIIDARQDRIMDKLGITRWGGSKAPSGSKEK